MLRSALVAAFLSATWALRVPPPRAPSRREVLISSFAGAALLASPERLHAKPADVSLSDLLDAEADTTVASDAKAEAMRAASKAEEEMKQKRAAVAMCAAREPRKTRALRM